MASVERVARGRVWTGEEAKSRGLVDELGGYDAALRLARIAAHLDPEAKITLQTYPRERDTREQIISRFSFSVAMTRMIMRRWECRTACSASLHTSSRFCVHRCCGSKR